MSGRILQKRVCTMILCWALVISNMIIFDLHAHTEYTAYAAEEAGSDIQEGGASVRTFVPPQVLNCSHYFDEAGSCECSWCGETVHDWGLDSPWPEEQHYECTRCGYVVHDYDYGGVFKPVEITEYIQINEHYHYAVGVMSIQEKCVCGAVNTRFTETEPRKIRYYHNFDGNTCVECHYVKEECAHAEVSGCICQSCGEAVHQTVENCVCEACGETSHYSEGDFETIVTGDGRYSTFDEHSHWEYGSVEIVEICSWCGAGIESTRQLLSADSRALKNHSWDHHIEGDFWIWECEFCEYQESRYRGGIIGACDHPETIIEEDTSVESITAVNDVYMEGILRTIEYEVCAHCGEYLGHVGTAHLTEFRHEHGYIELQPQCMECGYVPSCTHENYEVFADVDGYGGAFIRKDEDVHIYRGGVMNYKRCLDCGLIFSDYLLGFGYPSEIVEIEQPHEFEPYGGACKWCGEDFVCDHVYAENACRCSVCMEYTHDYIYDSAYPDHGVCSRCGWSNHETNEAYIVDDASAYHPLNEEYHQAEGTGALLISCMDCGYSLKTAGSEHRMILERHSFEEGSCTACGHTPECTHESATNCVCDSCGAELHKLAPNRGTWRSILNSYAYEEYNELCHSFRADITTSTVYDCLDHIAEETEYDVAQIDLHSFVEGNGYVYCEYCGYSRPGKLECAHENKQVTSRAVFLTKITEITPTHEIGIGFDGACHYCPDCGDLIGVGFPFDIESENVALQKPHTFVSGRAECIDCGYLPSCTHENKVEEETPNGGKYEKMYAGFGYDGENHLFIGHLSRYYTCTDCGATHIDVDYDYGEIVLPHTFEDYVCTDCGLEYGRPCDHTYSDENPCFCTKCWATRCEYAYDSVYTEHGVCSRCGRSNHGTSSARLVISDIAGYHQLNEEYHQTEGIGTVEWYCWECGYIYGRATDPEARLIPQEHIFENGVCTDCKYEAGCLHENVNDNCICLQCGELAHTWRSTNSSPQDDFVWTSVDERYCRGEGTEELYIWYNCGIHSEEKTVKGQRLQLHNFSDGRCVDCGQEGAYFESENCAHPNRISLGQTVSIDTITGITPTHEIGIGDIYEEYYCPDCVTMGWGAIYTTFRELIAEDVAVRKPHWFSPGSPVCRDWGCVYVSSCIHENGKEIILTYEDNFTPKDELTHTYLGYTRRGFSCPDCGSFYDDDYSDFEEIELLHTFENGVCTGCGYGAPEEAPVKITLPAALIEIKEQAFANGTFEYVEIPNGCTAICAGAFEGNASLKFVEIPASVKKIDTTAFIGCSENLIFITTPGSTAEAYAAEHAFHCVYN